MCIYLTTRPNLTTLENIITFLDIKKKSLKIIKKFHPKNLFIHEFNQATHVPEKILCVSIKNTIYP